MIMIETMISVADHRTILKLFVKTNAVFENKKKWLWQDFIFVFDFIRMIKITPGVLHMKMTGVVEF